MSSSEIAGRVHAKQLVEQFKAAPVKNHPYLERAFEAALDKIHVATKGAIVIIFGLTGVGKSTLRQAIERELVRIGLAEAHERPDFLPSVSVELAAPESIRWNWRDDLWEPLLDQLVPPVPNSKLRFADLPVQRDQDGSLILPGRPRAALVRKACEFQLRQRRPLATNIDEAEHLLILPRGTDVRQQLEVFKSVANLTETPLVLYGSYALLNLSGLSAQLDRRTLWVHFEPYPDSGPARKYFYAAVQAFLGQLPIPADDLTSDEMDELLHSCAGCVGTLKDTMTEALYLAVRQGAKRLTWAHIEAKSPETPETFWQELEDGRQMLATRRNTLASRLVEVADRAPVTVKPARARKPGVVKPQRRGAEVPS